MSELRDGIINNIIAVEGGYVNDPSDSGGETNYGITVDVARAYGYTGDMKDLPRETAYAIYQERYWDAVKGDELADLSEHIAEEVVDTGVNMGISRAGKFLQRTLNVFNNRQEYYDDIVVDGGIGNKTIAALKLYLARRGEDKTFTKALNCLQGAYYITLAERREKDEAYIYGWMKNRVEL